MKKTERKRLFRLLRSAGRFETHLHRRAERLTSGFFIRNYFWIFQVAPFIVAVIFAVIKKVLASYETFLDMQEILNTIGLLSLLVSYLGALVYPFVLIWANRNKLMEAATNPIGLLLHNASVTATVDARLIPRLMHNPLEHLELLALELKAEKDFFERRISLVIGGIEKIGLVPGLLAAGISVSNLKTDQPTWISALAYATPVLYIFGVAGHLLLMRLDRFVKVVELTISHKKQNK